MNTEARPQPKAAGGMVSFRPGAEYGPVVTDFADEWGLSRGEAARRLGILGATGFARVHYKLLARLAELRGGPRAEAFALTCRDLAAARDQFAAQFDKGLPPEQVLEILEATVEATEARRPVELTTAAP